MKAQAEFNPDLWADHQFHLGISLYSERISTHAAIVVDPKTQHSCLDSMAARVRIAPAALLPHDHAVIEGVEVRRTSHSNKLAYIVARGLPTTSLDTAVRQVVATAEGGRR